MPYSKTVARKDAEARIKALRKPFFYAKIRSKKLPTMMRDSVFQNTVFQISALFEDYIFQALSAWLNNLKRLSATNACIPPIARAVALARLNEEDFRRYISHGDEIKLAEVIIARTEILQLLDDTAAMPDFEHIKILIKDKKFPTPRNLFVLFRRFGIRNIHAEISKRTKSNFELVLQSFMDVRNALAHENPPSITDEDVERYFSQLTSWIIAIDRVIYSHIIKSSGAKYW